MHAGIEVIPCQKKGPPDSKDPFIWLFRVWSTRNRSMLIQGSLDVNTMVFAIWHVYI